MGFTDLVVSELPPMPLIIMAGIRQAIDSLSVEQIVVALAEDGCLGDVRYIANECIEEAE